jgi:predicted nucleic acid-binding protein
MYLDTSVLVKLFVREIDSDAFGKLTDGEMICSSILAYTEFWSALFGKERSGMLTPKERERAWRSFEWNVNEEMIELLPMSPAIFRKANQILERCHPKVALRSLDALHLASCDQLQDWPLITTDQRMQDAAGLLGFQCMGVIPLE